MTWIYFWNENKQKFGRFDFDCYGDEEEDTEDVWSFIGRVSDELWNVLTPNAYICFEDEVLLSDYETFVHLSDLIDWLDDGYIIEFGE